MATSTNYVIILLYLAANLIGYLTNVENVPWFSWQLNDPQFSSSSTFPTLVKLTGMLNY